MADTATIQVILVIALLVGWAYTHMGKSGKGMRGRKRTENTGSPSHQGNAKSKQQKHFGAKNQKHNRPGGKFTKK